MTREIDRRETSPPPRIENRVEEIRALASDVSDRLPGAHRVRAASLDEPTGGAAVFESDSAPAEEGDYVRRALDHLQRISPALGLTEGQPAEYAADPNPQLASSGAVTVHLQQHHQGIGIFQAAEAVRFAPDGALQETVGASIAVAGDQEVAPSLDVAEAVLAAARHVAEPDPDEEGEVDSFGEPQVVQRVDLAGFEPTVVAAFADQADRRTVLAPGPFGEEIRAGLVWFPLGDGLRLAWEVITTMPLHAGAYRTLVDAESGEVLYCKQLVHSVAARLNVFTIDGTAARARADCPLARDAYGLPIKDTLPAAFPEHWVAADRTEGNSVRARLGTSGPSLRGVSSGGALSFDPSSSTGDDQKVLNIFYYNCFMHDFFYLLGFDEASGNFQGDNFGRGGRAGDPVDACSHSGPVFGTANMRTPADGRSPIMNMGLVASTNRHTAFDSSVVFHEFTHGVTNRLVGGPLDDRALENPQSGGMGEGWGDYVACSINDSEVVGAWVVDKPGGIRGFRYDGGFPDGFGKLGTGRYVSSVHNIGEIWCATLLEMNRAIGKALGLQVVVDALKLSPANPSFLDMRDAILAALDAMRDAGQLTPAEHAGHRRDIWQVFARFGMGVGARSNGSFVSGIVASSEVPEETPPEQVDLDSEPDLEIPDRDPDGVIDAIDVAAGGTAARIAVTVEIPHTFIGDLEVAIASPAGTRAILQQATGADPSDDLFRTWTSDDTDSLRELVGEGAAGRWELTVADLFRHDRGRLARWRLEMDLEAS